MTFFEDEWGAALLQIFGISIEYGCCSVAGIKRKSVLAFS
jgi:hypothetical protein